MIVNFYKQAIFPRICLVPYYLAKIILLVFVSVCWLSGSRRRSVADSHLCIEAGPRERESIEFKELCQSACEYLPPENVHRLIVRPGKDYLRQIADIVRAKPITHYLYDPRTGSRCMAELMAKLKSRYSSAEARCRAHCGADGSFHSKLADASR